MISFQHHDRKNSVEKLETYLIQGEYPLNPSFGLFPLISSVRGLGDTSPNLIPFHIFMKCYYITSII